MSAVWYISNVLLTIVALAVTFYLNSLGLLLYSVGYGFEERINAETCFLIDGLGPASGLSYECFTDHFMGVSTLLLLLGWFRHPQAQVATVLVSLLFGQYLFILTAWGVGVVHTGGAPKSWGVGMIVPSLIIGLIVLVSGAGLRISPLGAKTFGLPSRYRTRLLAWGVVIMVGVLADILLILCRCPKLRTFHGIISKCDLAFHNGTEPNIWPVDGWTFQGVDAIMWSQMDVSGCSPDKELIAIADAEMQSVGMLPFPVILGILAALTTSGLGIVYSTSAAAARDACADSDNYSFLE